MDLNIEQSQSVERRQPRDVMRLNRLGSFHQSRLSFMRVLIRRMRRERWVFSQPVFDVSESGVGCVVLSARTPERVYSLVAFFHDLPDEMRSDRVIAEAWDATFALFDGSPTADDIDRLSRNVPLQEAGRVSDKELSLSRANRSLRLWQPVVDSLASGLQPSRTLIESVGYFMRTTAVYGSGKFGAADRESLAERPEFSSPFQVEMLAVYMIRTVVRDVVNHMARAKGGANAVALSSAIAHSMGIGNSTGLGMAPFLLNHPLLLNNWINAREEAIARVRGVAQASDSHVSLFLDIVQRANALTGQWRSDHPIQQAKLCSLRDDIATLSEALQVFDWQQHLPWNHLFLWAEQNLSVEGQEYLASLMLEPYGDLVDELVEGMSDNDPPWVIVGAQPVGELRRFIELHYDWALSVDWTQDDSQRYLWYVSAEKLEPRLGVRSEEPLDDYEQALCPARDIVAAYNQLCSWPENALVAEFLLKHPEHRHSIRRVQLVQRAPYAEIRDNTIGSDLLPIDLLRCKLSFFGASRFDPRSDRWVRICMFANAPYPEELHSQSTAFWPYSIKGLHSESA